MSSLRARCPDCRTLTAVAVDSGYQCHSCGREFAAGLVRVPKAWGRPEEPDAGAGMAQGAHISIPYPETAVIERESLAEQTKALAASLPERPLVLGGCCCTHVGAVEGLAAREGRLAVLWLDAHGDLNTPETSPSGNQWGMPLRMLLDDGIVAAEDVALIGARNLDPPEVEYLAATGIDDSLERALEGVDRVYVALDLDVLDPSEAKVFMPEPAGLTVGAVEGILGRAATITTVAGLGLTGFLLEDENTGVATRLAAAAGF